MKRAIVIVGGVLLLFSGAAWGQRKSKDTVVPAVILSARYVYVTAFSGDQFNPRIMEEDRRAINDVIDALKKWGRYAITYDQNNADLIIVVRKGMLGAAKIGGSVGGGTPGVRIGSYGGVEGGNPDDTLMVMQGPGDPLEKSALWRGSARNGLNGPDPALLAAFKKDVERAAAKKP